MTHKLVLFQLLFAFLSVSCDEHKVSHNEGTVGARGAGLPQSLKKPESETRFKVYEASSVLEPGDKEQWDAGERESLQIGPATSADGVHWIKDPQNPVLPRGNDLYLMYYGPRNHFDANDCYIRLAIYSGRLNDPVLSRDLPEENV